MFDKCKNEYLDIQTSSEERCINSLNLPLNSLKGGGAGGTEKDCYCRSKMVIRLYSREGFYYPILKG